MSEYFQKPKSSGGRVKTQILDLNNYSIKANLKSATRVDTSKFAKTVHLANLSSDLDKLNIDKLKNAATNLSNLKNKVDIFD